MADEDRAASRIAMTGALVLRNRAEPEQAIDVDILQVVARDNRALRPLAHRPRHDLVILLLVASSPLENRLYRRHRKAP